MRTTAAWAAALLLLGGALCFVPLFDVLGYEWCVAMAVGASIAGAQLGASRVTAARREPAEARAPGAIVARLYARAVASTWLALLPASVAILANAARVKSCDPLGGLAWLVCLPLASGALGAAAGVAAGLARPFRRAWGPSLLAFGIIACSIAWGVVRFLRTPPVFAYDPFVGYFPGSLYDEDVAIGRALLFARCYHAAIASAALAACALFLDASTLSLRARAARGRWGALLTTACASAVALALFTQRARLGFDRDAGDLARALGADVRTPHFVIHYTPGGPFAKHIDEFADDAEFRWSQHARLFGTPPPRTLHVFFFDSPEQARALVGTSGTAVTKGWRGETYMISNGFPHPAMAHELAHMFGTTFGDRWLGASRDGLHVNPGLMEGLAVAASWLEWEPAQPLDPHQLVKVLRDAKRVDGETLGRVMSTGFYSLDVVEAYAVAGSFCRFLLDTRGAAKLLAIHREGGAAEAWPRIYGESFGELQREWERLVDAQEVSEGDRAYVLEWVQPNVFAQPCAHAAAVRRASAWRAERAGDRQGALAAWKGLCSDGEAAPGDLAEGIRAAFLVEDLGEVRRLAGAVLARGDAGALARGDAERALGDAALLDGDTDGAAAAYDRAARYPANAWSARTRTLARSLCTWAPGAARTAVARAVAIAEREDVPAFDLAELRAVVAADPAAATPAYVLARQLVARDAYAEALAILSASAAGELPDGDLTRNRTWIRGEAEFHLGRYEAARAAFDALAGDPAARPELRRRATDARDRCDFFARAHASP